MNVAEWTVMFLDFLACINSSFFFFFDLGLVRSCFFQCTPLFVNPCSCCGNLHDFWTQIGRMYQHFYDDLGVTPDLHACFLNSRDSHLFPVAWQTVAPSLTETVHCLLESRLLLRLFTKQGIAGSNIESNSSSGNFEQCRHTLPSRA